MITYRKTSVIIEMKNLDCLTAEEQFNLRCKIAELQKSLSALWRYSNRKSLAENLRTAGRIVKAQQAEVQADDLYTEIPDSLKW